MRHIRDTYFLICLLTDHYRGSAYSLMWIKYTFLARVFCDGSVKQTGDIGRCPGKSRHRIIPIWQTDTRVMHLMTRSTGFVDIVAMVLAVFTCKIIIILYLNSKVLNNITIQNLKKD